MAYVPNRFEASLVVGRFKAHLLDAMNKSRHALEEWMQDESEQERLGPLFHHLTARDVASDYAK
jgi:hypothetical protein